MELIFRGEESNIMKGECPSCGKIIEVKKDILVSSDYGYKIIPAITCSCGNLQTSIYVPDKYDNDHKTENKNKAIGSIIFLIILIGLIAFGLYSCATHVSEPTLDDKKSFAWVVVQHEVEERLKAPSTAKFPWYDSDVIRSVSGEEDTFIIKSYVDADNSFGAKIRTNFIAKVKVNYEKETYTLLEIAFE